MSFGRRAIKLEKDTYHDTLPNMLLWVLHPHLAGYRATFQSTRNKSTYLKQQASRDATVARRPCVMHIATSENLCVTPHNSTRNPYDIKGIRDERTMY